ncbi:MAG: hypothetical protein ACYCT2_09215 [Thermoplasmataceae archaeon]
MMVVDTNVFLEIMLKQKRAEECSSFFQKVAAGTINVVVSRFAIHAIEAILGDGKSVGLFLCEVNSSLGLRVYDTTTQDEMAVTLLQDGTVL